MGHLNNRKCFVGRKNGIRVSVTTLFFALSFLSVLAIVWPATIALAQLQNATIQTGIANQTESENLTGTTFVNKTGSSNATTMEGLEKSQMGNIVPGQQNTTFEGQNMSSTSK